MKMNDRENSKRTPKQALAAEEQKKGNANKKII